MMATCDSVAETVRVPHRRGLSPHQSVPLLLGSGALKVNRTPLGCYLIQAHLS
jgi:hypothetical protein